MTLLVRLTAETLKVIQALSSGFTGRKSCPAEALPARHAVPPRGYLPYGLSRSGADPAGWLRVGVTHVGE